MGAMSLSNEELVWLGFLEELSCRGVFESELSLIALLHLEVDGIERSCPLHLVTVFSILTVFDMFSDELVWSV